MDQKDIQTQMQQLATALHAHNRAYYVLNNPQISDYQFDMLLKELEALENQYPEFADPNSPTKRVGGDLTKKFQTKKHRFRFPIATLSKKSSNGLNAAKNPCKKLLSLFANSNTTASLLACAIKMASS
jgi:NAD-dependent DNA ligase